MQLVEEPLLTPELIRARHDAVADRLRAAATAAGHDPDGFRIIAVTKGFGLPVLRAAWEAGLRAFGENRVQEALPKAEALPDAEWHLVGHLQANKARPAVRAFAVLHSIDSADLLQRLERIAAEEGRSPVGLLQVNLSGDPTRAGFEPDSVADAAGDLGGLVAVRVRGLMGIAPAGLSTVDARRVFAGLRRLRDVLQEKARHPLPELSMGMTADAEAAVAEGATLVRIGTAIFGPRPT
ncbi:MAG: YggS family pyridoxal phosphate-dependent enzyme [Chloroflexota bacterium]|nr:YggS family pyridoxal phosphate-dependent enzyme [Chloroflexota bacterium]